jgi:DUF4097 and DUF4098 domain-containing protein YvlB
MRHLALVFAVCALVVPGLVAADRWDNETEHVSHTVKLEPGGRLRLRSFSGRVTITATDRAEVVVEATRRAPRSRLDRIKLDVHSESPNTVVVDANRSERSWWEFSGNNVVETDLDVKVPRRTSLDVSVFSAPVTVEGVEGAHKLNSFSARLAINDVVGPVRAHTFSGPIQIRAKRLDTDQNLEVDTFSGNIDLRVPESARAHVSFNSFSGRLDSEMPLTLTTGGSRRALRAELGGGGGAALTFKTFSGSVRIDR